MPRNIDADLLASLQSEATTPCILFRVTSRTGSVIARLTTYPQNITVDIASVSNTFVARPGLFAQRVSSALGLTIDNTEVGAYLYSGVLALRDVYGTRLEGARYEIFIADAENLSYEPYKLQTGFLGEIPLNDHAFKIALRSLTSALHQPYGPAIAPLCRAGKCGEAGTCNFPFENAGVSTTRTGTGTKFRQLTATVGSVANKITFAATTFDQPSKWFAGGILTWLTSTNGNAGQEIEVRSYVLSGSTGTFVLQDRPGGDIAVGDTFKVDAGCNGTMTHCYWKFRTSTVAGYSEGNVKNFQGEPHLTDESELVLPATEGTSIRWTQITFQQPTNPSTLDTGDPNYEAL